MSHYDTLEVSPNASPEVIRAAYKSLMQRFHPDKNPKDAAVAARAAAIVQAYAVLSDTDKRAEYNSSIQSAPALAAPLARAERHARPAITTGVDLVQIGLWCLLFLVAVGGFWAFASRPVSGLDPRAELASIQQVFASQTAPEARKRELYARKLGILEQHPDLVRAALAQKIEDMAARTYSLLETPVAVRLSNETGGGAAQLTIRNISLLVGSFDSPVLLAHIGRHRERLIHDLTARLAREDPDRLARPDGEKLLKRVVLEAAAASLATDLAQEYPSTYFESPGRYGVVDVLLPEGFKLSFN